MTYLDNAQKFVCVLNSTIAVPTLMNALGHVTAGLAAHLDPNAATYLNYINEADNFVSKIAESPFIVLKAKNSSQLALLRGAAAAAGIPHNVFISAMIGRSAEEQLAQTRTAGGAGLEYWAVALFGDSVKLHPITKKFSVFSSSSSPTGG